jgi:hypothetical protein
MEKTIAKCEIEYDETIIDYYIKWIYMDNEYRNKGNLF